MPYPLGPTTLALDYTQQTSGLPTQLMIESPSQWSIVNDTIASLFGLGATGCLKSATTFPGGTGTGPNGSGGAANYVAFKVSDGNDGNSHYYIDLYCDSSANPTADEYYMNVLGDDGWQPASTGGTGQNYGPSFEISPIYKQAQSLSSLRTTITPSPRGLLYIPSNIPAGQFFGYYAERAYRIHALTYGNTIRIGIQDIHPTGPGATSNTDGAAINGFLSLIGEPTVGDEFTRNWKYSGGNYNLTYHTNFHALVEFQCSGLMVPKRFGIQMQQYHNPVWRIGNMGYSPWVEAWWPKFVAPPDSSLLVGGYLPANAWQGSGGPIIARTGATQTTGQLTARAPVGFSGTPAYQWKRSTTPGGTFTNTATNSLTMNDSGLTANSLYYYMLVATGSDMLGTPRVVTYPQQVLLTKNTSRTTPQSFYIDSAAGSNGTGTIGSPFNSLANFYAANLALIEDDQVFLVSGAGHAVYQGPLTIKNVNGIAGHPVVFTSTDQSNPAVIQNFGHQFASGNGIEIIDCNWVTVKKINVQGPGLLQLPGTGSDFEANGTTVVGAGGTATRTSTAGNGVQIIGTQNTCLPNNRTGQTFQQLTNITTYSRFNMDTDYGAIPGYHGEDGLDHKGQGIVIDGVNVTGMYLGIVAYAAGTHEEVDTTVSNSSQLPPYQIRYRQGQEFLTIQNCTIKDCPHTGIWMSAEMRHRDPTGNNATNSSKAINPLLDPAVYDSTDTSGADAVATALYGQGTIIRANVCNAGPTTGYSAPLYLTLQTLNDHPMEMHHRGVFLLNNGINNVPGDNFYAADGSLNLYNSGNGVGANHYQGMPGGQSGFGINVFCTDGCLVYGGYIANNGRTDRGSAGPIGILYQNMQYAWTENLFLHDCKGPSDGGALDWDGRVYYGVWVHVIGVNNNSGFAEITGYGPGTNAHANCLFVGCVSLDYNGGGAWVQALPTGGHRDMFLACFGHDDSAGRHLANPGALVYVNNVWTGNNSSAITEDTGFNNSQHLHQIYGGYIWNYGSGGVGLSNFDQVGVSISNPGLPNDTPGNHPIPSYPLLVVNTNGANAPDLSNYSYGWAKANFTNWIPTVAFPAGIDPATVGVRYPAAARTDITGAPLATGFNPIGVIGTGSANIIFRSLTGRGSAFTRRGSRSIV